MKRILTLILATLIAVPVIVRVEVIAITVSGMVCSFCAQGIKKTFNKNENVKTVTVDLERKLVTIETRDAGALSDQAITQIINDAGYDVVKIERGKNA